MHIQPTPDSPPSDFVAFLAQRGGLSQEAAEDRLERWFGEYHALCQSAVTTRKPIADEASGSLGG
jgi:hypothetical protein